jgi:hypothetical protein
LEEIGLEDELRGGVAVGEGYEEREFDRLRANEIVAGVDVLCHLIDIS